MSASLSVCALRTRKCRLNHLHSRRGRHVCPQGPELYSHNQTRNLKIPPLCCFSCKEAEKPDSRLICDSNPSLSLPFTLLPVFFWLFPLFSFFLAAYCKIDFLMFPPFSLSSLLLHPVSLASSFKSVTFDVKWRRPERSQPLTHKNTHAHGGLDVEGKVRPALRGPNHPLSLSGLLTQSHLIGSVCACEKCDHGCNSVGACGRVCEGWIEPGRAVCESVFIGKVCIPDMWTYD